MTDLHVYRVQRERGSEGFVLLRGWCESGLGEQVELQPLQPKAFCASV